MPRRTLADSLLGIVQGNFLISINITCKHTSDTLALPCENMRVKGMVNYLRGPRPSLLCLIEMTKHAGLEQKTGKW